MRRGGASRATIRPLEPDDVTAVAAVYERVMRSSTTTAPPPRLVATLERYFLGPWHEPEIPSLVATDRDGAVVGFIGASVRPMIFDGRPIRLAASGPLVSLPEARSQGVGAMLLKRFLSGAQDIAITDGGTEQIAAMWTKMGGVRLGLPSLHWVALLAPAAFALDRLCDKTRLPWLKPLLRPVGIPVDLLAAGRRAAHHRRERKFTGADAEVVSKELTPEALVSLAAEAGRGLRLRQAYNETSLRRLFTEMEALTSRGPFLRRLIVTAAGQPLGWYIAFMRHGCYAEVIQLVALPGGGGAVLDDLMRQAFAHGALAVRGRLEPHLLELLTARRTWFVGGLPCLVQARDPAILTALSLGQAHLSRFDGEWWMALHLERYQDERSAEEIHGGAPPRPVGLHTGDRS